MESLAKMAFVSCCCVLFGGCGGGGSSVATDTQSALLEITTQNKSYAAVAGIMAPVIAASVSGEVDELPVAQSRRVAAAAKRSQARLLASKTSDVGLSETYACGISGDMTYTLSVDETVETYVFSQCKEQEDDGDYTLDYTIDGWERYTNRTVDGYDQAYLYEESTTYDTSDSDGNQYTENYQNSMTFATNGDGNYLITGADYTYHDKGSWYGITYDYTLAGQGVHITIDLTAGLSMTGRIGAWGTYYTGEATMGGMLDIATNEPVFFANDDDYGTYAPNGGKLRVNGKNGSYVDVELVSNGLWMALNGGAAEFIPAPQE